MVTLPLKPISVNRCWQGRRYLTDQARKFQRDAYVLIKSQTRGMKLPDGELSLRLRFGLSRDMDTSNCIKLVEDAIAKAFSIDDRMFRGQLATKEKVKRGQEFIAFDIVPYDDSVFVKR